MAKVCFQQIQSVEKKGLGLYLLYVSGRNWSIKTVSIPLNDLSLSGFKNSYLKSLFLRSTPLFVLTDTSSNPSR